MKTPQTPKEILDSLPPSDVEAEMHLVGSMLLTPKVIDDVVLVVGPRDFYSDKAGSLFAVLSEMNAAGKPIDAKLAMDFAQKTNRWDDIGSAYLAEAYASVPTSVYAVHYAELVREVATKRELRMAATEILRDAHAMDIEANELLNVAEEKVLAIRDHRGSSQSRATDVGAILMESMAALDKRQAGALPGLETGFPDLDKLMAFRNGELLILAARPSMGKTALALNIAANVAECDSVLFFSLEMNAMTVGDRLLSGWSEVPAEAMQRGTLTAEQRTKIVEASVMLAQGKLTIDDSVTLKVQDIAAVCRRHKRRKGLSLVVVDYLQLVKADNPRDPREQQVASISKRLKQLARDLEVPVLCLAQLNREIEKLGDKRPRLSHLRESGAIEQDADVVAFVHRPEMYEADQKARDRVRGIAEICVEKNRNGRTGRVPLTWMGHIVSFKNCSLRERDNYEQIFDAWNESE